MTPSITLYNRYNSLGLILMGLSFTDSIKVHCGLVNKSGGIETYIFACEIFIPLVVNNLLSGVDID